MKLQTDIDEHKRATASARAATAPYAPPPQAAPQQPQQQPYAAAHYPASAGGAWPQDANGWGEFRDPTSGQAYFYNSRTGESSWVRPPELSSPTAAPTAAKPRGPRAPGGGGGGGGGNPNKGPPGANLFIARAMRRGDVDLYDSAQLRATFEVYGPLLRAEMAVDKESGANKGFGFVSFADVQAADRAIGFLQGQVVAGKALRIEKTKEDGAPQPAAAGVGMGMGMGGTALGMGMMPHPLMGGYAQAVVGGAGWGPYGGMSAPPPAGAYMGGAYPPRY